MTTAGRAVPELSVDTQTLERILWDVPVGDTIGYDKLTAAIGRNVQGKARHILDSAVRRCLNDKEMVFGAVHGVGLKRLTDVGILSVGEQGRTALFRKSGRVIRKLAAANYTALNHSEQTQYNTLVSQFGVLRHMTSTAVQKKLETRIEQAQSKLPVAKMLDEMRATL